jgi:hypothetical protein
MLKKFLLENVNRRISINSNVIKLFTANKISFAETRNI